MWPFIPRVIQKFLDSANLQKHNDNYNDIKSAMEDLAGAGRTNQTIKGNSDTVVAHLADHANPHVVTATQVGAYSKIEMQTSGQSQLHWGNLTNVPNFADAKWKAPVADKATLDTMLTGNGDGDVRLVLADEYVYEWDLNIAGANKWHPIGAIGNGLTSHSALTNLGNDDHLQYLRTDGTRALTGNQDFSQHEAKNLILHKAATAPVSPVEGQPWYDTTNHALKIYKGSVSGWVDISGRGAVIKDQLFTALASQTVFDITVGQYQVGTNAISIFKQNSSTLKFDLLPEGDYAETNPTRFTLSTPATVGDVFYVKFFENTPEVIAQSVVKDGTLQINLNSDLLHGHNDTYFATDATVTALSADVVSHGVNITSSPYNASTSSTDNISAIQAAINAASAAGIKTVWIPDGIFIVAPTTSSKIILPSNITLDGTGTLKIKNNNGDFTTLFGQAAGTISNVAIKNITIDQNPTGNTTCNIAAGANAQLIVYLTDFNRVRISNVKFNPCSGVNTVSLNGATAKNARVKDCYFNFVRGTSSNPLYDNSSLYLDCTNHRACGNTFESDITQLAFGAIETHNGLSNVYGNTIRGYQTMVNVVTETGTRDRANSDINVYGNTGTDVMLAIRLWSLTGKVLCNVNISANVISINQVTRLATVCGGVAFEYATGSTLTGAFDTINIIGNTIYFEDEGSGRLGTTESATNGIALRPKGNIKNVQVLGNTIVNAPTRGIVLGNGAEANTSQNVTIKNNMIINAGQNLLAVNGFRAAITTESVIKSCDIIENHINDTNTTFKGYQSLFANTGTYSNSVMKNNYVSAVQGGYFYDVPVTVGLDIGDSFKTYFSSVFPATSGSFDVGDILSMTGALTAGKSIIGYKCTAAGTYGTLAGVTGTTTLNSQTVVVNDSSALKIGDYIFITGTVQAPKILSITGNTLLVSLLYSTAVSGAATAYFAPTLKPLGVVGPIGKGTTANRPASLGANDAGLLYFDTTLVATQGKPIWWNGANWIDNTGAIV